MKRIVEVIDKKQRKFCWHDIKLLNGHAEVHCIPLCTFIYVWQFSIIKLKHSLFLLAMKVYLGPLYQSYCFAQILHIPSYVFLLLLHLFNIVVLNSRTIIMVFSWAFPRKYFWSMFEKLKGNNRQHHHIFAPTLSQIEGYEQICTEICECIWKLDIIHHFCLEITEKLVYIL